MSIKKTSTLITNILITRFQRNENGFVAVGMTLNKYKEEHIIYNNMSNIVTIVKRIILFNNIVVMMI